MAKKKKAKQVFKPVATDIERVWVIGVDPGLGTTGLVLCKHDVPVAAVAASGHSSAMFPLEVRTRAMALFVKEHVRAWVIKHKIDHLFVQIETSFLRPPPVGRGVNARGLMAQMTLYGMMVSALFELQVEHADQGLCVWFAPVHNQTVKAVFTGDGDAAKFTMISNSAWAKRSDVEAREHLADAQAIASVYGEVMSLEDPSVITPCYIDDRLGKGVAWRDKLNGASLWPPQGRSKRWSQP